MSPSWAASCPKRRGDLARLQASESVLGSLLSGESQRGPVWLRTSESALCNRLPGESPCVAFASVADGPVECDVPQLAKDPGGFLVPICYKVNVVVLLVGSH